jgi:L-ascorbate metabolism protein UlaG (beta-lactamase superfamily)
MEIKYLGHSSFFIKTKSAKLVTDPFNPEKVGLKFPKQESDIITISHNHADHNYREGIKGEPIIFDWPGEYEKNEVHITGYPSFHDKQQGAERGENVIYKIEAEKLAILHVGDLGHSLSDELIEEIGGIDILMVPVGGVYSLSAEEAVKLINEIEPSIVIPMHYNRPELDATTFGSLQTLDVFLKAMGVEGAEPQEKLSIKKEEINPEEMKVVVLSI